MTVGTAGTVVASEVIAAKAMEMKATKSMIAVKSFIVDCGFNRRMWFFS